MANEPFDPNRPDEQNKTTPTSVGELPSDLTNNYTFITKAPFNLRREPEVPGAQFSKHNLTQAIAPRTSSAPEISQPEQAQIESILNRIKPSDPQVQIPDVGKSTQEPGEKAPSDPESPISIFHARQDKLDNAA